MKKIENNLCTLLSDNIINKAGTETILKHKQHNKVINLFLKLVDFLSDNVAIMAFIVCVYAT